MIRLLFYVATLIVAGGICAQPPKSQELMESDAHQRRDLSLPHSRIVLNFFDFKSTNSACVYGTAANLPLHAAWLSTEKNDTSPKANSRFSRAVPELLMLYRASATGMVAAVKDPEGSLAQTYSTTWAPHALGFVGRYANGSEVQGQEFLADEETLVRQMRFTGQTSSFVVTGRFQGAAEVKGKRLLVRNGAIRYAIELDAPGTFELISPPAGFRPLTCRGVSEAAWGGLASGRKPIEGAWWSFKIDPYSYPRGCVNVVVKFAESEESDAELLSHVHGFAEARVLDAILAKRTERWDRLLQVIPEPDTTDLLKTVNPKGVTAEGIRQAYYKAWVFTIQNVIPADKKCYPYPQLAAGKPSLWDEGEKRAPFSAAWESFLGTQFYAFIDPKTAVESFKGLMSLVDQEGMLGGESLPSRKAQTAMILYRLTGDRDLLKETYPALCRYMEWRMKISHWVYGNFKPNPLWKDAEFVFSAIIDMEHLADVATLIGKPEEAKLWQDKRAAFYKESQKWFWKTPTTPPVQNWCGSGPVPNQQDHAAWVTTAFYMDGMLQGDYLKSTLAKFDKCYNTDANFAGFGMPKYPDMSYTVYGLLKQGYPERARGLMEACIRDIVRAGAPFAEQYVGDNFRADGVRPSLFGSSMIIDFTMLMNGYKYDRGTPTVALTYTQDSGVAGLLIRGKRVDLKCADGKVLFGEKGKMKPVNAKIGHVVEMVGTSSAESR
ncbi:MAG: hypothetical protein WCP12_17740 [bacterium]